MGAGVEVLPTREGLRLCQLFRQQGIGAGKGDNDGAVIRGGNAKAAALPCRHPGDGGKLLPGGGAAAALLYSLESEHKILCRQRLAVTPLEIFPQGEGIAQAIGTDAVIFGAALGHGAIRQAAQQTLHAVFQQAALQRGGAVLGIEGIHPAGEIGTQGGGGVLLAAGGAGEQQTEGQRQRRPPQEDSVFWDAVFHRESFGSDIVGEMVGAYPAGVCFSVKKSRQKAYLDQVCGRLRRRGITGGWLRDADRRNETKA